MLSRRAALKGGIAVACVAAAGMVAAPVLAAQSSPDARVFTLIEESSCVMDRPVLARRRCYSAIKAALPSHLRSLPANELIEVPGATDAMVEIRKRPEAKVLLDEEHGLDEARRALESRLAETPGSTLEGIHAKLQDAIEVGWRGRCLKDNIAPSAADELARLAGKASS